MRANLLQSRQLRLLRARQDELEAQRRRAARQARKITPKDWDQWAGWVAATYFGILVTGAVWGLVWLLKGGL